MKKHPRSRLRMGPTMEKVLLLLSTGLTLSLTYNPSVQFKIIKTATKEWRKINQQRLREAIKRLYISKLVEAKHNKDGTISLVLNENGRKKTIRHRLETIKITKPKRWDGLFRIVLFDIPEDFKRARDALSLKLRELGFYRIQKSVFAHYAECRDEIDFITELFELKPYVRFLRVKEAEIDIGLDLKRRFNLL